jgi:hypothetical protein
VLYLVRGQDLHQYMRQGRLHAMTAQGTVSIAQVQVKTGNTGKEFPGLIHGSKIMGMVS